MLGTEKGEEFLDVAVDSQGTLFLAGYENGDVGASRFDPSGDSRGVLWRMGRADGATIGKKVFDIPDATETLDALAFHPDTGALYFAGRTTGAFEGFTPRGAQDIFIVGPRGSESDVILYQGGTERPQHPNRLDFDAHRDLIVSGYDDVYVPPGGNYVERWEDPFVLKLRWAEEGRSMAEVWWRQFDTSISDMLGGLAVDSQGDSAIYVTGTNSNGTQDGPFVRKIDNATGQLGSPWRQTTIGMDMMQAAHLRADGSLLIAGSTFARLGTQAYGEQDVVVRVLDTSTGQPVWTTQFGSEGSEWVTDMAVDAQGNILVVGETLGAVDPAQGNRGDYDVFLMKFDPEGKLLLARQWGSAGDDHPNAVAVDACGEVFIVGYTTGDLLGPRFPWNGSRDAFLLTTARPGGRLLSREKSEKQW
ncbi:SBBP repeat-containing protein [Archangium violaceum]|nr:SBBP repeat-containing protein [Archangium violaceum]